MFECLPSKLKWKVLALTLPLKGERLATKPCNRSMQFLHVISYLPKDNIMTLRNLEHTARYAPKQLQGGRRHGGWISSGYR